jgi:RimJ/RimL family protein N-acetyltransferase
LGTDLWDNYPEAMIDPEVGWRTDRLDLEPLVVKHSAELAAALDDPALHDFTGGSPLTTEAMAQRNSKLETRRSPDGSEVWANWVLRVRDTGAVIGTVQATMPTAGPSSGSAEVAWVVARPAQGRRYAREAATSLVGRLRQGGWTVVAHIHPDHLASQQVARAAGMSATDRVVDGEIRWTTPTGETDAVRALDDG